MSYPDMNISEYLSIAAITQSDNFRYSLRCLTTNLARHPNMEISKYGNSYDYLNVLLFAYSSSQLSIILRASSLMTKSLSPFPAPQWDRKPGLWCAPQRTISFSLAVWTNSLISNNIWEGFSSCAQYTLLVTTMDVTTCPNTSSLCTERLFLIVIMLYKCFLITGLYVELKILLNHSSFKFTVSVAKEVLCHPKINGHSTSGLFRTIWGVGLC